MQLAKRALICIVMLIWLWSGFALSGPRLAAPSLGKTSVDEEKQGKTAKRDFEESVTGRPVLWEEPVDLESRDLFYGIGGQKGAPDPSEKYIFLKRDTDGTSEKASVEDSRDRKWTVKFGSEPRPETTATRIVWAVGFHVDQDYYVERAIILRGREELNVGNVRFERDNDGYKKVGRWGWKVNPFVGTRELDGLKTLMAFLNNFDLKEGNNKIVRADKKKASEETKLIYYVNDLGATLGSTGYWFGKIPIVGELPSGSKGIAEEFAEQPFIEKAHDGEVKFHMRRTRADRQLQGVKVENARWMGDLLARLSDKQLEDAFRAGGFNQEEFAIYLRAMRNRIDQLRSLK